MKSERFATAIIYRRIIIICVFLFSAVANPLLFTFQLSTINYQLSTLSAQVETGIASYYAKRLTGRRTASGERFHHDSLTCAHRTLPFGTMLNVRDTKTGKEVVVRVTDRGPFGQGRVVDLSWQAAKELGILSRGVAQVELTVVGKNGMIDKVEQGTKPEIPQLQLYDPQTGEYLAAAEWEKRAQEAEKMKAENIKQKKTAKQPRYRVQNGRYTARAKK